MKPLKIIYNFFAICISIIALLLIISVFPLTGNYKVLVVHSGSMQPAIKMGSVVVVKPSDNYKIGDIITFGKISKTQTSTTHRIYEMKVVGGEPVYITKGDANNAPDQKEITGKEIIGKVLFDVPYLGYVVDTAKKPIGFLVIIIVPTIVIISDEMRKIQGEIKKRKGRENHEL